MRITRPRVASLTLAAMMALSACASPARYPGENGTTEKERTVAVEVTNHNWMDVVVYAVSSAGNRVRLGSVTTGLDQRFKLPRSLNVMSGNFYLEARPVGSGEVYNSGPILANPGARVIWSIENQLGLSSYRVAGR